MLLYVNVHCKLGKKSHFLPTQVADQLLCEPSGQEALKAVYRFVSYNSEWIQRAVGVSAAVGGTSSHSSHQGAMRRWGGGGGWSTDPGASFDHK